MNHSLKKHTLSLCLTAILAAGVIAAPAQATSIGGATLTTGVNLRSGAGTGYEILTSGAQGENVVVTGDTGTGWYQVLYRGISGYMSSQYLKFSQTLNADLGTASITGTDVRLRSAASTAGDVLGSFQPGAAMSVTGVHGNWYQVTYQGTSGYVHSDYLQLEGAEVAPVTQSPAQQVLATAKSLMGLRYIYGGTTTRGFDCSGYTQYVFAQNGVALERTAAQQYNGVGDSVAKSDLQPGDLVFFASSSQSIGHVGIYVGDGKFIHSSSGAGKVVITDLTSSYYVRNYVGAKRVLS